MYVKIQFRLIFAIMVSGFKVWLTKVKIKISFQVNKKKTTSSGRFNLVVLVYFMTEPLPRVYGNTLPKIIINTYINIRKFTRFYGILLNEFNSTVLKLSSSSSKHLLNIKLFFG